MVVVVVAVSLILGVLAINDQIKLLTYWVLDTCDTQADRPQDNSPLPTALTSPRTR